MDYAHVVGMLQRVQHLCGYVYRFLWAEIRLGLYIVLQGLPVYVLENYKAYTLFVHAHIVRLYYVWMGQRYDRLCLPLETAQEFRILPVLCLEHLYGYGAALLFVVGLIYVCHAAGAYQAFNPVLSGDYRSYHHSSSLRISTALILSVEPP